MSTQSAKLYEKLKMSTAENAVVRNKDFKFLISQQLDHPFDDIVISKVEATSIEIDWNNFSVDETLSLCVGVLISLRVSGNHYDNSIVFEQGTLCLTTDGTHTEMSLIDIAGAEYLEFNISDFDGILSRLSPKN